MAWFCTKSIRWRTRYCLETKEGTINRKITQPFAMTRFSFTHDTQKDIKQIKKKNKRPKVPFCSIFFFFSDSVICVSPYKIYIHIMGSCAVLTVGPGRACQPAPCGCLIENTPRLLSLPPFQAPTLGRGSRSGPCPAAQLTSSGYRQFHWPRRYRHRYSSKANSELGLKDPFCSAGPQRRRFPGAQLLGGPTALLPTPLFSLSFSQCFL